MLTSGDDGTAARVLRVSELNLAVRKALEREFALRWVAGEISGFTRAASGHWYFQLKDERAQVRCVMFRNRNALVQCVPAEGMAVEVFAAVTLYEARGDFQLGVEAMRPAGLGALFEAFERLKQRLTAEGLFDAAFKRPLPAHPRVIGVLTSPQAAALRDVLATLGRRAPHVQVIVYPTPVQGEGAAARIAAALQLASERGECDTLILCRGGGSIEDLWSFNDEGVARAVRSSRIPVVAGIGHETDFTIADFAADARAATPTAAAEMASPARAELAARVDAHADRLARALSRGLENRAQHLDHLGRRLIDPGRRMELEGGRLEQLRQRLGRAWERAQDVRHARVERSALRLVNRRPDSERPLHDLDGLGQRLLRAAAQAIDARSSALGRLEANLGHLNPTAVLERGFAVARKVDGQIVHSSAQLAPGESLEVQFARGVARTRVEALDMPSAES